MKILCYIAAIVSLIASLDVGAMTVGSYSSLFVGVFFLCVGRYALKSNQG